MVINRFKPFRSLSFIAYSNVHPTVLNRKGVCTHTRKIITDRSHDGINRGEHTHQGHDTNRDNQRGEYCSQQLTANTSECYFYIFADIHFEWV